MPRSAMLSSTAIDRIERLVAEDLLGTSEPSVTLYDLRDEGELLNKAAFMAEYLTAQLRVLGSGLYVEEVERYYFDFSPYGPVLGAICYLGLYDPGSQTRRLFTLGTYNPGMKWMPEQNEGPRFESDRRFLVGARRQCELHDRTPAALLRFTAPMAAKVRAYVEARELTDDQQYDLDEVLKYTRWEAMEPETLVYIALALGTTLEAILAGE